MSLLPRFRFDFLKQDISAGFVVFLVALPLCLGIALASEAPPIAGIISGIVAGVLVSLLSGSELSVSGPAAGLTMTVIAARTSIGSFEGLLVATALSGAIQIVLGTIRAGLLAAFFPSSVIKGMLAGIGILIAFKQIPHAVGWMEPAMAEEGLFCLGSPFCLHGFYQFLREPHERISFGAVLISGISLYLLILWERLALAREGVYKTIPGPLLVVALGILCNAGFSWMGPWFSLKAEDGQLVTLPALSGVSDLFIHGPKSFTAWLNNSAVWSAALVIAIIGSIETLLSLEATDKLDPLRRTSRPNRELIAQGTGNIVAGLLGGIPMTSVIVRSSTNVYAGGRTRLASMFHGLLLLISILVVPGLLNQIPLASLAAILMLVGYKLSNVKLIKQVWAAGFDQFLPFIITIIGVVGFDLLTGVTIGTIVGLLVVLVANHHLAFNIVRDNNSFYLRFAKDVTFVQKIALKRELARLPNDSDIIIDGGGAMFIDHDIFEMLEDFRRSARDRNINLELRNFPTAKFNLFSALRNKVHDG
jgi:MFS superfamily sulfate permease-like transporter